MSKKGVVMLISGILIVLGIAMFLTGYFVSGANGINGVYIDESGIHTIKKDSDTMETQSFDKFTAINCDVSNHNIKFVEGTEYKVEYSSRYKNELILSNDNGILNIKARHVFTLWLFSWFNQESITVYYPKDAQFDEISAQTTSGNILAESPLSVHGKSYFKSTSGNTTISGLSAESVTIHSTSGTNTLSNSTVKNLADLYTTSGHSKLDRVTAKDVTLKSTSGNSVASSVNCENITATSTSGKVSVNGAVTASFKLTTTSGEVSADGSISGNGYAKSTSGSVRLYLTGSDSDYSYTLSSTSGSCRVNGGESYERINPSAKYKLEARTTSGSISVFFDK